MKNKTNKVKWTKKFKAVIISLSLAFVVALGGALTAVGISLTDGDKLRGGTLAGSVDDSAAPAVPINEDLVFEISSADQWAEVIAADSTEDGYAVAKLTKNIKAVNGSFGTSEDGDEAPAYVSGALSVPSTKYVVLDLGNYTIDRGLTAAADGGHVITNYGHLYITGGQKGKITGGYSSGVAGGVRTGGGNSLLTLAGGSITGNTASGGGGVTAYGPFNMTGGSISGNTSKSYGGGIFVGSTVTITGGEISGNTATSSGGGFHVGKTSTLIIDEDDDATQKVIISNNTAGTSGGGIYADSNGASAATNLTITGGTISGNTAGTNGGGVSAQCSPIISGATISGNTAASDGGGIYSVSGGSTITSISVNDSTISGNTAKNGGGISCLNPLTLTGGTISGNTVTSNGGGIYSAGTLTINGGEISNNNATAGGGLYMANGSSVTIENGTFENNTSAGAYTTSAATSGGGAIFVALKSDLTIKNVTLTNNSSSHGGGIYVAGSGDDNTKVTAENQRNKLTIDNITATGNTSSSYGGAIYLNTNVDLIIKKGTFTGNTSDTAGGGAIMVNGYCTAAIGEEGGTGTDVQFIENAAPTKGFYGGAVYFDVNSEGTLYDCDFIGNTSSYYGGAIYVNTAAEVTVNGGKFEDNRATEKGGAIRVGIDGGNSGTLIVNDALFQNNYAGTYGGAISSNGQSVTVDTCYFYGNVTNGSGGALSIGSGTCEIKNCIIGSSEEGKDNTAANRGGGVYNPGTTTIIGGEITGNSANMAGGVYTSGVLTLDGVEITGNYATMGGGVYKNGSLTFKNTINITDNYGAKYNSEGKLVANTAAKNNLTLANSGAIGTATYSPASTIGVNTTRNDATAQSGTYGINMIINSATPDLSEYAKRYTADFASQSIVNYSVGNAGYVILKNNSTATTNYDQWVNAATNSSDANPITVKLTSNWTADNTNGFKTSAAAATGFDSNGSLEVPANKNIILDLAGHQIIGGGRIRVINVKGTLTVIDSSNSTTDPGQICGGSVTGTNYGAGVYISSTGTLILNGGAIMENYSNGTGNGGGVYNEGTFVMNGGYVSGNEAQDANGGGVYNKGKFIMNGGTIGSDAFGTNYANNGGGVYNDGGTFTMNGGTISKNSAQTNGGGVYVNGGTFTMNGGTIGGSDANKNTANFGSGVYNNGGTMTMKGGTISYHKGSAEYGGGVYLNSKSTFIMEGGTISDNSTAAGSFGAGIYAYTTTAANSINITLTGGTISNNSAAVGGGIYVGPYTTLNIGKVVDGKYVGNVKITGNTSHGTSTGFGGGAIYASGNSNVNLYSGTISGGNTAFCGGGIYSVGTTNIYGGNITGNYGKTAGAGIYVHGGTTTISGGNIYGNKGQTATTSGSTTTYTTTANGGGVYVNSGATLNLSGTAKIYNNLAVNGGGVYVNATSTSSGKLIMTGGEIYGNTTDTSASTGGAGVYAAINSSFTMSDGKIYSNSSYYAGGGVLTFGTFNFNGGEIYKNTAYYGGGIIVGTNTGILNMGSASVAGTGKIYNNTAKLSDRDTSGRGGGLAVEDGATFNLYGGEIYNNTATYGGGMFKKDNSPTTIYGGEIYNNTANSGGGIYVLTGTVTMNGGTISGNTVPDNGGGVYTAGTFTLEGGTISGNRAGRGGGIYVAANGVANLNGGLITENVGGEGGGIAVINGKLNIGTAQTASTVVISNNTANTNGGGIYTQDPAPVKGVIVNMYGGTITGNYAGSIDYGGGGILVNGGCTFNMYSGVISGNTTTYYGGGVYCRGTFNMYGGTISGNEAFIGGGVYNGSSFTMYGGTIGGETAADGNEAIQQGGGVYNNGGMFVMENGTISNNTAHFGAGVINTGLSGTFEFKDGEISYNVSTVNGAGGVYAASGTVIMSGGVITGNTSAYGSGIQVYQTGTLTITGGEITGNRTTSSEKIEGAVSVSGTLNLSGNPVITGNTLADGKTEVNVRLSEDNVINVTGAISSDAEIGVTLKGEGALFTSGFAANSGLTHPNQVFTADNAKLVVGKTEEGEGILTEGFNVKFTLTDLDGNTTDAGFIKVDKNAKVEYATPVNGKFVFNTQQGGGAITVNFSVPAVAGYTPHIYNPSDANHEVLSGESVFAGVPADDITLNIRYVANTNTQYKVYYILQNANQADNNGYTAVTDPNTLATMNTVKVYTGTGTTDSALSYKKADGKALEPTGGWTNWTTYDHYSFDSINVENPTIGGEGTTYVLVYMKLNEYTVSFTASGANPSMQTKTFRYGATISNEGIEEPILDSNTFAGWYYDAECTREVAFGEDLVEENVQLYAKFDTAHYKLIFDFNVGGGADQIPNDDRTVAVPGASNTILSGKVKWDTTSLFPAESNFGFKAADGVGRHEIDYTVNNVNSSKRIDKIIPTAIGYTFDGWYEVDEDGNFVSGASATTVIRRPSGTNYTTTLKAKWRKTSYTLRFELQNGQTAITKPVLNMSTWESILPTTPTRSGYTFQGWYITNDKDSDHYMTVSNVGNLKDENGKQLFSVADFARSTLYGSSTTTYNFSTIRIYAEWESLPIYITVDSSLTDNSDNFVLKGEDGNELSELNSEMKIGDEITVEVTPKPGYELNQLMVGTRQIRNGITTFTILSGDVQTGNNEALGGEYKYISIGATFIEDAYEITYMTDGGKIYDPTYSTLYSVSNIDTDDDAKKAVLPKNVKKEGYDFVGWIFETSKDWDTQQPAHHENVSEGGNLYLVQPYNTREDRTPTYRDVTLLALWKPQQSAIYLYNAMYDGENGYTKPAENPNAAYYRIDSTTHENIVTGRNINLINPSRGDSFVFLGWATTAGGAVVYPAVDGSNTIAYTVNADKDVNGNALNRNNLYAVWHIAGVNYIIMSADNNDCTYGTGTKNGVITMSAQTARKYESSEATSIKLNYTWYKIVDGMYDMCFETKQYEIDGYHVYVDANGGIVAYEKDGKYYEEDKVTEKTLPEGATALTYKEFKKSAVTDKYCVEKTFKDANGATINTKGLSPTDLLKVQVRDVNDCGVYVCVVEVVGEESEGGTTTTADGYGEIEITMKKAVYSGVVMQNTTHKYDTTSKAGMINISAGGNKLVTDASGVTYLTLPDGSRLVVTYKYFVGEGELREEITDLSLIKSVGTYHVVASFAFTPTGDKGNYELPETLEADLIITATPISGYEYVFIHKETEVKTGEFKGEYDGEEYKVVANILDTTDILDANAPLITERDDIAFDLKVYKQQADGSWTEVTDATIDAGSYYVQIVGLKGNDKDNYTIASSVTTRKDYTISKKKYAVAAEGNIEFEDAEATFNNQEHSISIKVKEGFSIPDEIEVEYETAYEAEDAEFTAENYRKPNKAENNNGGIYAGTYTVTAKFKFKDEATGINNEALEDMTATLTIKKADFFGFYNVNGVDLLRDGGFISESYAYIVGENYNPSIKSGMLTDKDHFSVSYEYYRVDESDAARIGRTMLASGTHEELVQESETNGAIISLAGKYEIVARIKYASALYRNNFEEVTEDKSTITLVIREGTVEKVTVDWADDFDMSAVKLGEAFDYKWIKQINVKYADNENLLQLTRPEDIALAGINLGKKDEVNQTTFWHVGEFDVKVSFYAKECDEVFKFTVTEEIANFKLKYSTDGTTYEDVPEKGLELGGTYTFKVEYDCTDAEGNKVTGKLSDELTIADGGLVLGENVLTADEENYSFTNAITVKMYQVVSTVTWEYYDFEEEDWLPIPTTNSVEYAGQEQQIRVKFGDKTFAAHEADGKAVLNTSTNGYLMQVGRVEEYDITAEFLLRVTRKVLEFTWDSDEFDNKFDYNSWHQSPVVVGSSVAEADKASITFDYSYKTAAGATASETKTAGSYKVTVVLRGDSAIRANYTLEGSETAEKEYEIVAAEIKMHATQPVNYVEYAYAPNTTYAENTELRVGALRADFGDNPTVSGKFAFIKNYNAATGEYEVVKDGKDLAYKIAEVGEAEIEYVYIPDDKNYKEKVGQLTIIVNRPTARTGNGALSVEFGKDAVQFYLVGQEFDTHGIEVYRLYDSTYQENGKWYGKRVLVPSPSFRIGNFVAGGYKITSQDLSSEMVVLRALDGTDSGTLNVSVVDKTATGLEVLSKTHRTEYYLGEQPTFDDIEFRVLFGATEKPQDGLKIGTIKVSEDFSGTFDTLGTVTVTFTYFNESVPVTFTVKAKENLEIINPTKLVLNYTGSKLEAPALQYRVDGNLIGQNDLNGVTVTVTVRRDGANAELKEVGTYRVRYSFVVTNPRFNTPANIELDVQVTDNPYEVSYQLPKGEKLAYTGKYIPIPKPTIGTVTDKTNGGTIPANRVIVEYKINDVDVTSEDAWNNTALNRGSYEVQVTVKVRINGQPDYVAMTDSYIFEVLRADNDKGNASIKVPSIIILDGKENFNFEVTADFGADKAVLTYSRSRNSGYTTAKPTTAGTWFVKAEIAGTDNYQGIDEIIASFEVRNANATSTGVEGSISGGEGLGDGWTLEISDYEVEGESISGQNVLDGYKVVLKDKQGQAVTVTSEYTVKVKLSEELSNRGDLKVFFKDAESGKVVEKRGAKVEDGYLVFNTSDFGTFIITNEIAVEKAPAGLIAAVVVLGVVAAGGVAACVVVFLKKRKRGAN